MTSPASPLPDIQRTRDTRDVEINRVGVTGIRLPIRVRRRLDDDGTQTFMDTVGEFEMAAHLPVHVKGTHMSRFTEVLNNHISKAGVFSITDLQDVALQLITLLETDRVFLQLRVDYFMPQNSPATGRHGMAPMVGILQVVARNIGDGRDIVTRLSCTTGLEIQGKTCCPCSREISEYDHATGKGKGAHAQRGKISVMVHTRPGSILWFETLAQAAWLSFSQPVYPVLKRPDEASVTMGAYANPKFVEDVIRDMTVQVRRMHCMLGYSIRVQNAESIHYHDAYAEVSGGVPFPAL